MTSKKIAIIGGSGFLGTSLVNNFAKNNLDFTIGDIKDSPVHETLNIDVEIESSMLKLKNCDCIINLAALHRDDVSPKSRYEEVNVHGAENICKVARRFNINKIIFTSSVAIYGFAPKNTDESGQPNYFNEYGRTKYLAEQIFKKWQKEDPLKRTLVIIRPTVIFGPGNRGNVYNLLKQINSKRFAMFGDGKNVKSMAYVENVSSFIRYSLGFGEGVHIYNYVDEPNLSMNELVTISRTILFQKKDIGLRLPKSIGLGIGWLFDIVAFFTKLKFPISSIRVKKFLATTQFSSSIDKTGFVAPYCLKDSLEKTLRYEFLEDNSDKVIFETE